MGGRLHRRGAGTRYRLSNKSFGFPRVWGGVSLLSQSPTADIFFRFIGHNDIVPKELGFFVEVTRRLHPEINKHISWLAYENKLHSHPDTVNNVVPGTPPGLHPVVVQHSGNSTYSPEEVEEVLELVARHAATLPPEEILIVAPYNAQANAIRKALDEQGFNEIQVGTVDKFQGREGMVVIVSLAASNADDAPRGLGFLLDRNRLNVAISRAKSVCYLVHCPGLLRASFPNLESVLQISRLVLLTHREMKSGTVVRLS